MVTLSKRATYVVLGALLGLTAVVSVAAQPEYYARMSSWAPHIANGMRFANFLALISIAAFWMAAGFPRPVVRIVQSVSVCGVAVLASYVSTGFVNMSSPELFGFLGALCVMALCQWTLMVGLLWPVLAVRDIRLRHVQELSADHRVTSQFAIRDIAAVTIAVAVFLASIRWWVLSQQAASPAASRTIFFFGYLLLCNLLITVPLLFAPLLRRHAIVCSLIAVGMVGLATVCEIAIFLHSQQIPWPYNQNFRRMIWSMNCIQALWVLLAMGALRLGGYRLSAPPTPVAVTQSETGIPASGATVCEAR